MSYFNQKLSKIIFIGLIFLSLPLLFIFYISNINSNLPRIAIANYGSHFSLHETIQGIKDGLEQYGLKDGEQIEFEIADVNFESTLISQMLTKLKIHSPKVIVAMTTPVAQVAKNSIKNIPIVFTDITDPVESGLLHNYNQAIDNISGASDRPNLNKFLAYVKKLMPDASKVGILYATGESNDKALIEMMQKAANAYGMKMIAVPVDQARDIPIRMQSFKDKVDFIYVGTSGPIQPSLPAIMAEADRLKIPVFNSVANTAKDNQVLGSFAIDYYQIGINTAEIINKILNGEKISSIAPIYPKMTDYRSFVSKEKADKYGIELSSIPADIVIVE